ncbi:MAG: glycosyltransferase [Candidatus Staskawiczbacteria bacterium]|jgi:glycosyltransferase involved in cell wall biosynthesis
MENILSKKPLVTICFLAYNCEKFLAKSINPLLKQTYSNFEFIISNNQSTDGTEKLIHSLQKKHSNIIYRKNISQVKTEEFYDVANKDFALKSNKFYDICLDHCNGFVQSNLAKGEYIIFCHQDDIYHEDIIEKEAEFLTNNPKVMAVFTLGNIINENDKIIGQYNLPKELSEKNIYNFQEVFTAVMKYGNSFLVAPTFMVRKEIFDKLGLFEAYGQFGGSGDLEMWLRILEKYSVGILHENLIDFRISGRGKQYNTLRTEKSDFFDVMDYFLIDKQYIKKINKKNLRQYNYQKNADDTLRSMNFLIKGNMQESKKLINTSFSWDFFITSAEDINIFKIKILILKVVLFLGINLGLGKYLGKILYKLL